MQDRILAYWRTLELLQPHAPPKEKRQTGQDQSAVFAYRRDDPLPWAAGHSLAQTSPGRNKKWQHTVYAGLYSTQRYREWIEHLLGRDNDAFDRRDGEGCQVCFLVDENGHPILQSLDVSAAIWALGQTQVLGPDHPNWLAGDFDAWASERKDQFALRFANISRENGESDASFIERATTASPIDHDTLEVMAGFIFNKTLANDLEIRIASTPVSTKGTSEPPSALFNSFFATDLWHMAAEARTRTPAGDALDAYLTDPADGIERNRIDITRDTQAQAAWLHPSQFPIGRWPETNGYPLVFSQQLAINDLWSTLRDDAGLRSINGPPGTGKTTLLRDLVAAVVVERAQALAACPTPSDAFAESNQWRFGDKAFSIQRWISPLRGHGLVATSANNGAVENISLELPEASNVNDDTVVDLDYFSDLATELLRDPANPPKQQLQAWGLLAARLGKKGNNQAFTNVFWWGNHGQRRDREPSAPPTTFREQLSSMRPTESWSASVKRFQAAVVCEQKLRDERIRVADALLKEQAQDEQVKAAIRAQEDAEAKLQQVAQHVANHDEHLQTCRQAVERADVARSAHQVERPGFFKRLFLRRQTQSWRTTDTRLAEKQDEATENKETAQRLLHESRDCYDQSRRNIEQATSTVRSEKDRLSTIRQTIAWARDRWGDHVPDPGQWSAPEHVDERELSAPWSDPEWRDARGRVFVEALRLHRAFLAHERDRMKRSLSAAVDTIQGRAPADADQGTVADAWDTLFFVMPLISTTFASLPRLFRGLPRASIGWLLIDEAGQAVPQAAAVGLWRARRGVVVGDPLQLTPIFNVPYRLQRSLACRFDLDYQWDPADQSTQTIADRANPVGTTIERSEESIWVGMPLRVHRRCQLTMFRISNAIAYDGLMVFGGPESDPLDAPASCWFDINDESAFESGSHSSAAEIATARSLLESLDQANVAMGNVFLISPFRDIVRKLQAIAHQTGARAGTIHTTQGKEASIVVLVLGGNPEKPGARAWAAGTPNLLNVAASRARHRLYIVGNRTNWAKLPYFEQCAALLPFKSKELLATANSSDVSI